MRRIVFVTILAGLMMAGLGAWAVRDAGRPTPGLESYAPTRDSQAGGTAEPRGPQAQPRQEPSRAQPGRAADPPPTAEPQRQAQPRREAQRGGQPSPRPAPPPRTVPPRYHVVPRVYYFPPVSVHRNYYYHPYFGFYFGPYYGPYYPYPGPYAGYVRYSEGAIRARVKPVETQVYVNGYYAGLVDDFDGVFQRLYLPAGEHVIEFYLEGHETYREALYLSPGDTREVVHQMRPLPPGAQSTLPDPARRLPKAWMDGPEGPLTSDRPSSPFGILALHLTPADAQVLVDNEVWLSTEGRDELVIHVPAGWHTLEIRREGYRSFKTDLDLSQGQTTRLSVQLER
jgi:hypothetical protein